MLLKFYVFALMLVEVLSEGSFFIDKFQGTYHWAYPLSFCVPTGIVGYPHASFGVALDGDSILIQAVTYNSSDTYCEYRYKTWTDYLNTSFESNGLYASHLGGRDYVAIKYSVGSCSSPISTVAYKAANVCYRLGDSNTTYYPFEQIQCNSTIATFSTYTSTEHTLTCNVDDPLVYHEGTSYMNTTCAYLDTIDGYEIYAQLEDCVYGGSTVFPVTQNNSGILNTSQPAIGTLELTFEAAPANYAYDDPDLCEQDWFYLFKHFFNESFISLTTQCIANEQDNYHSIWVSVYVEVFFKCIFVRSNCV